MPFQIITEIEQKTLQIGATIVKFVKDEEKYVSEVVSKEIADDIKGLEGYTVKTLTEAEAKAAKSIETKADKELKQAVLDGEAEAKALAESEAATAEEAAKALLTNAEREVEKQSGVGITQTLGSEIAHMVGNLTGADAKNTQSDSTQSDTTIKNDVVVPPPHLEGGDGGTSTTPEAGKPLDPVVPANVDQKAAKAKKVEIAERDKGVGGGKPAEQGGPKK